MCGLVFPMRITCIFGILEFFLSLDHEQKVVSFTRLKCRSIELHKIDSGSRFRIRFQEDLVAQ